MSVSCTSAVCLLSHPFDVCLVLLLLLMSNALGSKKNKQFFLFKCIKKIHKFLTYKLPFSIHSETENSLRPVSVAFASFINISSIVIQFCPPSVLLERAKIRYWPPNLKCNALANPRTTQANHATDKHLLISSMYPKSLLQMFLLSFKAV